MMSTARCQQPQELLRIVVSSWPGYEPLYSARDLGYLNEGAVRITQLPFSNLNMAYIAARIDTRFTSCMQ